MKEFKGWKLLNIRIKTVDGYEHFYERWVHVKSKSGIVFYSTICTNPQPNFYGYEHKKGSVYFVVEGYGIGTIDPKTFKEITNGTCIQHTEYEDREQAILGLQSLILEKNKIIEGK